METGSIVGGMIVMQQLYDSMQQLIVLHESLVSLSHEKTKQIKQGDMDELAKLLMKERKQIQAITQAEAHRQKHVNEWILQTGSTETDQTMTSLLATIDQGEERNQLEAQMAQLIQAIIELREAEQLNQNLLEQSMQFVQLSLDMLQPSIQNLNYDGKQQVQESGKQSVFDSKA